VVSDELAVAPAREEVLAVRATIPAGERLLWVDRYKSLRDALPAHWGEFAILIEHIVRC
jgi:hypothetical protein